MSISAVCAPRSTEPVTVSLESPRRSRASVTSNFPARYSTSASSRSKPSPKKPGDSTWIRLRASGFPMVPDTSISRATAPLTGIPNPLARTSLAASMPSPEAWSCRVPFSPVGKDPRTLTWPPASVRWPSRISIATDESVPRKARRSQRWPPNSKSSMKNWPSRIASGLSPRLACRSPSNEYLPSGIGSTRSTCGWTTARTRSTAGPELTAAST